MQCEHFVYSFLLEPLCDVAQPVVNERVDPIADEAQHSVAIAPA